MRDLLKSPIHRTTIVLRDLKGPIDARFYILTSNNSVSVPCPLADILILKSLQNISLKMFIIVEFPLKMLWRSVPLNDMQVPPSTHYNSCDESCMKFLNNSDYFFKIYRSRVDKNNWICEYFRKKMFKFI